MKRVVIESPYAGQVLANVAYAKRCMLDCLTREEAPYASHLLLTQDGLLEDTDSVQRTRGIEAGLAWGAAADLVAVYVDRGISAGMLLGIERHASRGKAIECRALDRVVTSDDWRPINDIVNGQRRGIVFPSASMEHALCREALEALGELWAAIPEADRPLYDQDRSDVEGVLQRALSAAGSVR